MRKTQFCVFGAGVLLAAALTACGGSDSTPVSPSPSPAPAPNPAPSPAPSPVPAPTPAPTTFTLSGTVTDSVTTSALTGSTVTIFDGVNVGRSTATAADGTYSLTGLTQGAFTIRATLAGYTQLERAVNLTQNTQLNFALVRSVPPSFTGTWRGRVQSRSCRSTGEAFASLCNTGLADSLTLILTQNGTSVTGSINVGGSSGATAQSAGGTATGNQLVINGIAPNYNGFNISYEGWLTTISGNDMTGGFSIRFFFPGVPGSASFDMVLVGVTRVSN
jgi:carboxypeptidase family protein